MLYCCITNFHSRTCLVRIQCIFECMLFARHLFRFWEYSGKQFTVSYFRIVQYSGVDRLVKTNYNIM